MSIPTGKLIAVDTEGTGLNPWIGARPFAVSFCNDDGKTGYMRWAVCPHSRRVTASPKDLRKLYEFFLDTSIVKVFHNAPYDLRMLDLMGVIPQSIKYKTDWFEETFFGISICNSLEINRGLKPLCKKYLSIESTDEKALHKSTVTGRRQAKKKGWRISNDSVKADFWLADPELCKEYAIIDAERTIALWVAVIEPWIEMRKAQKNYQLEKEVLWANWDMMERGVRIDIPLLQRKRNQFNRRVIELKSEIFDLVGYEFEISKAVQLRKALFEDLGLTAIDLTTKTKQPSTAWKSLQKINHPVIELIAEHDSTVKGVQALTLYKSLAIKEGNYWIIHPNYNQVQAKTGRMSCVNPNLMNVSNPETSLNKHAKSTRDPYGPRPGFVWYSFDFSKQEALIFACLVHRLIGDRQLIDWFEKGLDPYAAAANLCWGNDSRYWEEAFNSSPEDAAELMDQFNCNLVKAEKELNNCKDARTIAKSIWLGTLYGMGVATCAKAMNRTENQASQFLWQMHKAIPAMKSYQKALQKVAEGQGFIHTWFDRPIAVDMHFIYRAVNYQVQGTAADQCKIALVQLAKWFRALRLMGIEIYLVLAIHDEIIIEILRAHVSKALLRGIKKVMGRKHFTIRMQSHIERIDKQWDSKKTIQL